MQSEMQAHDAEATLARLSEEMDDLDQTIPGPTAPGRGPASAPPGGAPGATGPGVVLSVLAGGRQGNPRD